MSVGRGTLDDIRETHKVVDGDQMIFLPVWAQAVLVTGNILVLIGAICGNIAAALVILRARLSKTSTRFLLLSLALSDFILASSTMPIDLGKLLDKYHSWIFGSFVCEFVSAVQTHFFMMNAFCLFSISVERYMTVIRSAKVSKLISPIWEARIPYILLILTWLLPFGCSVRMAFAYEEWSFWIAVRVNGTYNRLAVNETFYLCQQRQIDPVEDSQNGVDANLIVFISIGCTFFILLIAILFCYLSILVFVSTHWTNFKRNHPQRVAARNEFSDNSTAATSANSSSTSSTVTNRNRQKRTVRLILGLILLYLLCRAPNWIYLVVVNTTTTPKTQTSSTVMYFIHLIGSINTALSPFVYAIWNDSLRTPDAKGDRNSYCCFTRSSSKDIFSNHNRFGKIFLVGASGNTYDLTSSRNKGGQSNSSLKLHTKDKNVPTLKSTTSRAQDQEY